MPNCSERPISAIVVDPDIAVRPCNDVARNVVGVDKENRIIVDHLINAAVPRWRRKAPPFKSLPRPVIVIVPPTVGQFCQLDPFHLKRPNCEVADPDVALQIGEHCVHLIRRVVQNPGSAVEFRHSAEHRVRQPHVIVSADVTRRSRCTTAGSRVIPGPPGTASTRWLWD